jgi:predicted permease
VSFSQPFRQLRTAPAFSAVVIGIFALGIGATTAIFGVVNGVLLRPLPYPTPDRLVQLWEVSASGGRMPVAGPNFDDVQAQSLAFAALAEMSGPGVSSVTGGREPVRASVSAVSQDFFRVLGLSPVVGRTFQPDEQHEGATPTAVISNGFWQRTMGGDPAVLGRTLHFDDKAYTVIGVLPAAADLPVGTDIWTPAGLYGPMTSRTAHNWHVVGRLRTGVTVEQANREVAGTFSGLHQKYGDAIDAVSGAVVPLREQLVGSARPTLLVLLAASFLLLLIACTNAANLLVARLASRQNEIAVRTALGASSGRLLRQFLWESLVLSIGGGIVGIALGQGVLHGMLALQSGQLPRAADVTLDWRVMAFAFVLSCAAGAVMALVAAWRATHRDIRGSLSEAQRTLSGGSSYRLRSALVVAQFALTLPMLAGAGLLARSFQRLLAVQPGFITTGAAVLEVSVPAGDSASQRQRVQVYDALARRLRAIPGVASVGGVSTMPLAQDGGADGTFLIMSSASERLDPSTMGRLFRDTSRTGYADFRLAGPGYFKTMHIPVLSGRGFDDRDEYAAPNVAVISKSLADARWPGRSPIGQVIQYGNMDGDLRPFTIVGVVGDVREANLAAPPRPVFYGDYRQRPAAAINLSLVMAVQPGGDEGTVMTAARKIVREVAPDVPPRLRTIESIVSSSLVSRRFTLVLVATFGLAALVLAALGIYGVTSYLVAERRREFGIRLALGATGGRLLGMVLRQGAMLALAGIVAGGVLSIAATRAVAGLLYGVSPGDPVAFLAVTVVLAAVALAASWIPARRAARREPAEVLR